MHHLLRAAQLVFKNSKYQSLHNNSNLVRYCVILIESCKMVTCSVVEGALKCFTLLKVPMQQCKFIPLQVKVLYSKSHLSKGTQVFHRIKESKVEVLIFPNNGPCE